MKSRNNKIDIDRKFLTIAVNPAKRPWVAIIVLIFQTLIVWLCGRGKKGGIYTQKDSVLFLAKDRLFLSSLHDYAWRNRVSLGRDNPQTISVKLLLERVQSYQKNFPTKLPDVDAGLEMGSVIKPYEWPGKRQPLAADAAGGFDGTGIER